MRFQSSFRVAAPPARVAEFHRSAASLKAITPPLVPLRVDSAPDELSEGDEIAFTMWLVLLPVRWRARIEDSGASGFTDVQLEGPFRAWRHRHTFIAAGEGTEVRDEIDAQLATHPFWWLVGLKMWLGLPLLFAFRRWRTKRLLEG